MAATQQVYTASQSMTGKTSHPLGISYRTGRMPGSVVEQPTGFVP